MKILCTCPGYIGVCSVFKHGASLGLWAFKRLEDLVVRDLAKYDLIIFGAWVNEYNFVINYAKQHFIKTAVLITSSLGQVEQTNYVEMDQMNQIFLLKKLKKIDYVFVGSKPLYECLKADNVKLFPYPFNTRVIERFISKEKDKDSIGLFLPTYPRKNILNQLYAFRLLNDENPNLKLHTNVGVRLQLGLGLNYYDILPDEEFFKLVSEMRVNLHVTHTESFAYFFAESLTLGTPCLISPCIADNFGLPKEVKKELLVKNPDSTIEISQKIKNLIELDDEMYQRVCNYGKLFIEKFSMKNNKALKELLGNI